MATVQQLIDDANRVIAETQQGGNTQSRIGNLYLGIIDFIDILDRRTIDGYEYDDTALKEAIRRIDRAIENLDRALDDALAIVTQERDRLDNLVNELDQDIENKVNRMLDDASTLQDHAATIRQLVNEGEIYWKSEWDANIEAYLQEVGVWARDGDVIKTQWSEIKQDVSSIQSTVAEVQTDLDGRPTSTQWSQITQKVNSIEQSVNSLVNDGDITEALQSSINQSIENGIAKLSLDTTYAKIDVEDSEKVLEWMYAAFKNASSSEMSYAQMVAAGKSGINNGVSEVRTYVNAIRDGDFLKYEAVSSIESKMNDVITGLYNKASAGDAQTTIFSQVKKGSEDIAAIVTHCTNDYSEASIASKFDNFRAGLVVHSDLEGAKAELTAAYKNDINISTANLVLESTMNSALAQISADYNNKFAGVIAKADLEGAVLDMLAQDTDHSTAARIFMQANSNGSTITLNANQINMNASTTFMEAVVANSVFTNYLAAGKATFYGEIRAKQLTLDDDVSIDQDKVTGLEGTISGIESSLDNKANKSDIPTVPKNISDLIDDVNLVTDADVYVGDVQTDSDTGIKYREIKVGNKDYIEIINNDFVIFGRHNGSDSKYFKLDTDGLLTAKNAIIWGQLHVGDGGSIAGWSVTDTEIKKGDTVGMYSGGTAASAIRFWAGGSRDTAPFRVTHEGKLYSTNADIEGAIVADTLNIKSGEITGKLLLGSTNKAHFEFNPAAIYEYTTGAKISGFGSTGKEVLTFELHNDFLAGEAVIWLGDSYRTSTSEYLINGQGYTEYSTLTYAANSRRTSYIELSTRNTIISSYDGGLYIGVVRGKVDMHASNGSGSGWPTSAFDVPVGGVYVDGDVLKVRME